MANLIINSIYKHKQIQEQIRRSFYENSPPSITLHKFFTEQAINQIKNETTKASYKRQFDPLRYSYSIAKITQITKILLDSQELLQFLKILSPSITKIPEGYCIELNHQDYSLLHDEENHKEKTNHRFDLIIDLSDNWPDEAGGKIVYTKSDGEALFVPASTNTLTLVSRAGFGRYIEYCNHKAKKNKRKIILIEI